MSGVDFAAVFEAMPIPTAVLSPGAEFLAVNRAYEAASGWAREQLIGELIYERFPGGAFDQGPALLRASLERVVADRRVDVMPLLRYDVERPDGIVEERYWSLMNAPVLDGTGAVRYVIHRGEEATAFVQQVRGHRFDSPPGLYGLEARMQVVEADLFARTVELEEANRRLRGLRERERRAVADTSHDLRGPITGLQTRLQVALEDPMADPQDILRAALEDAEHLGDIVADLLELARLESGGPAPVDPVDLAALVEGDLARRAPQGLKLAVTLEGGVTVAGSKVRLARLVANLLANAERHAVARIEVSVGVEDGLAVLRVADDGPGIPPEDREAVFARFFRRADARKADPGGTGLGLPISREIAHAHGGSLVVADGSPGAVLELRLPLRTG
ncbi:PAS domain-containing protein [Actinocorallia sp. API 0066]|uniref:PAS domain-containing sensor histidine kinase n=1 Tax=Actinocorallia sp. API 0066 TaxID=2896846 RepID=UPI001E64B01E|nr:ATP-binding protein [Actinocorallia sp. API 0066]MCD0451703.1 PAS domain-containing protein [Actinocorallia sp. API 0066]